MRRYLRRISLVAELRLFGVRVALVASGGGHVRQLLDLEPFWSSAEYFFVTEDTALTRALAAKHPVYFIPHVALGQARLGKPVAMLMAALRSFFRSWRIMWGKRPDVVITTGAGSSYFPVLFARMLGAKIVLIDSFARFAGPSAFARIAAPLAHIRVAQSADAGRNWPGSWVFDPFRRLDKSRPAKESLAFATVGATLPFERLVSLVDQAKRSGLLPEKVILQSGQPLKCEIDPSIEVHPTLTFEEVNSILARAEVVICHGGTGSIITALQQGCRVIVVPRSFARGEHYDDHQWEIAEAFAHRGLLSVVGNDDDIAGAIAHARASDPVCATLVPDDLIGELKSLVAEWKLGRIGDKAKVSDGVLPRI
ncbi:beta-1,4-glucuronosyltransferase WelK [Novosphingobium album (ex Hu et al. 2023)]|uniref:Exopolysaccharide biosynthesis protein n=1 Tax=Novosphingobium album (ex Hu et al. 2023) TaxID=2930093 RepID=A0ABT0B4U1_9SPHN|nr:glycosyltransferase [Novosphingobium album (ex Hu et al. 2023)]MCJ2180062.1 exopolysaccharide biosynthesis protein [Novosphingobium album (ex Hu et al. 2023)]